MSQYKIYSSTVGITDHSVGYNCCNRLKRQQIAFNAPVGLLLHLPKSQVRGAHDDRFKVVGSKSNSPLRGS
jgi:hypothetical protein